jgi:chromosome segregation protein
LETRWQEAHAEAAVAEQQVQVLLTRVHEADESIRGLDRDRHDQQQQCTKAQVHLATMEERLSNLRSQHQQTSREHNLRSAEQAQSTRTVRTAGKRLVDSQLAMLNASAQLAQAFLDKESSQAAIAEMIRQRDAKRGDRARLAQQAQSVRGEWRTQQEAYHQRELEVNDLRHRSETLCQRIREDYQVELAEFYQTKLAEPAPAEPVEGVVDWRNLDIDTVQTEIAELRKKLAKLGSVNLDALAEMEELERRSKDLQTQFDDLVSAKKSLEEIIAKINQDSKRMFLETYQTVRTHFQELFRKVFGGGMADIVLEDENDVLESGLEIIARPPGKELRTISLMSGGEKTLTAVALLLAVFRSKPAPFCLLDEVDAALDEANIGRFTAVLREFTDLSQFILVTHSKKTMASADVLYGITMQESGISKQVAVRFEDWVEEERSEVA